MDLDNSVIVRSRTSESLLSTHRVLRNTYLLLSLTLVFSGFTAFMALNSQVPLVHPFMLFIASMVLLFVTQALRNSALGLVSIFAFTGLMGYMLGPLLNFYMHAFINGPQLVMTALGGTGLTFLGLSAYILTTRKDMSFLTGFMVTGGIVLMLAIVASLFFHIPALSLTISAGIIVFSVMGIMWRTSAIIHGGETNYISATIGLYLDIYNLFINLLRILSFFSGRRN
jgi:modulator of FtsH protease